MKTTLSLSCKHPSGSTKAGFFYRRSERRRLQRYRCRQCGKSSSSATRNPCYRQKKRHLNRPIEKYLNEGLSLRAIARLLGISYNTVVRKKRFLAPFAKKRLEQTLNQISPNSIKTVQFDELITFEHTKCKPLSVCIVVEPLERKILSIAIAPFRPSTVRLAQTSSRKYGHRPDLRASALSIVLNKIAPKLHPQATIETDECPWYPTRIRKHLPASITHRTYKGKRATVAGQGELKEGGYDPLFSTNHTFAMIRAHVSRLIRRTWNTTKDPERLHEHLAIYADYHNRVLTAGVSAEGSSKVT